MVVERQHLPGGVKAGHLLGLEGIIGGEAAGVDEGSGQKGNMGCQQEQCWAHQGEHEVVVCPQPTILVGAIAGGVHHSRHCHHQQRQPIGEAVVPPAESQRVALHGPCHTQVDVHTCHRKSQVSTLHRD